MTDRAKLVATENGYNYYLGKDETGKPLFNIKPVWKSAPAENIGYYTRAFICRVIGVEDRFPENVAVTRNTATGLEAIIKSEHSIRDARSFFAKYEFVIKEILAKDVTDTVRRKAIKAALREFNNSEVASGLLYSNVTPKSFSIAFSFSATPEGFRFWHQLAHKEDSRKVLFPILEALALLADLTHRERQVVLREVRKLKANPFQPYMATGFVGAFDWSNHSRGFIFWSDIAVKIARSKFWSQVGKDASQGEK